MKFIQRPTLVEWGFLVAMVVLCGVLSFLQYRWTGELARAELVRLRANLGEQTQLLVRDFDDELTGACVRLVPTGNEIDDLGRDSAYADRLRKWQATNPRPIFSRLAVAAPSANGYELLALDQKTQKLAPMPWPATWGELRDHLGHRPANARERGGAGRPEPPPDRPEPGADRPEPRDIADRPEPPPDRRDKPPPPPRNGGEGNAPIYMDRTGTLTEFPIQGGRLRDNANADRGWMIFELDAAYAASEWLPQLLHQYLDPQSSGLDDVVVRAPGSLRPPIFSSRGGNTTGGPDVSLEFNHEGHAAGTPRGLSPKSAWTLELWHRPGAFESMVAASRRRNLAVAAGLNLLILVAGVLLVQHTRRSRKLAEMQMNFVAAVSHELRTPLTVIRGAAHNLERGVVQEPEAIARYLRLIIDHGSQLNAMVEQVLEYASAKKAPALMLREPVAIDMVLSEAIANAAADIESSHCEVEFTSSADVPPVAGDPAALRRAFQNLIANAARHGGDGGWIGVTVSATNGSAPPSVEVQVADRGAGIPGDEQAEIFKPFVRGAAAQSRQVRGSGLGLSLVREIIAAHGGAVALTSRPGEGAIFTVRLPAQ